MDNNTFFNFKLDLEPNLVDMIYDMLRMSTIQLVTQIMFYMNNSSLSLFSESFIKTFVFINFGIAVYYLVIRKIFSFVPDDYLRVTDNVYTKTPPMNWATPSDLPKAPALSTASSPPLPVSLPPTLPKQAASGTIPNNTTNTPLATNSPTSPGNASQNPPIAPAPATNSNLSSIQNNNI